MAKASYGKDHPESFIAGALKGGSGPSNSIQHSPVDRPDQTINTALAMDNVKMAMNIPSSILDDKFAGGPDNVKHSLNGATAVSEEVGAAGGVKHVIIPNH